MEHSSTKGKSPSCAPVPGTLLMDTNENDVVLGRGKQASSRAGNIRFRAMAVAVSEAYIGAQTNDEKTEIARGIIDDIHGRGGRFIRAVTAARTHGGLVSAWEVADEVAVMRKVKQAIRDLAATALRREMGRGSAVEAAASSRQGLATAQSGSHWPGLPPASSGESSLLSTTHIPDAAQHLWQQQHLLQHLVSMDQARPQQQQSQLLHDLSLGLQQQQLELLMRLQQQQRGGESSYQSHLQHAMIQRLGFPTQPDIAAHHPLTLIPRQRPALQPSPQSEIAHRFMLLQPQRTPSNGVLDLSAVRGVYIPLPQPQQQPATPSLRTDGIDVSVVGQLRRMQQHNAALLQSQQYPPQQNAAASQYSVERGAAAKSSSPAVGRRKRSETSSSSASGASTSSGSDSESSSES